MPDDDRAKDDRADQHRHQPHESQRNPLQLGGRSGESRPNWRRGSPRAALGTKDGGGSHGEAPSLAPGGRECRALRFLDRGASFRPPGPRFCAPRFAKIRLALPLRLPSPARCPPRPTMSPSPSAGSRWAPASASDGAPRAPRLTPCWRATASPSGPIAAGGPCSPGACPSACALRDIAPGEYVCNRPTLEALAQRDLAGARFPAEANFENRIVPFAFDEAAFRPAAQVAAAPDAAAAPSSGFPAAGAGASAPAITSSSSAPPRAPPATPGDSPSASSPSPGPTRARRHRRRSATPKATDRGRPTTRRSCCGPWPDSWSIPMSAPCSRSITGRSRSTTRVLQRLHAAQQAIPSPTVPPPLFHAARRPRRRPGGGRGDRPRLAAARRGRNAATRAPLRAAHRPAVRRLRRLFREFRPIPSIGAVGREVIRHGGAVNLAETDELVGAESYILRPGARIWPPPGAFSARSPDSRSA